MHVVHICEPMWDPRSVLYLPACPIRIDMRTTRHTFRWWWCRTFYSDQLKWLISVWLKLLLLVRSIYIDSGQHRRSERRAYRCIYSAGPLFDAETSADQVRVTLNDIVYDLNCVHDVRVCNKENFNLLPDKVYIWDKTSYIYLHAIWDRYRYIFRERNAIPATCVQCCDSMAMAGLFGQSSSPRSCRWSDTLITMCDDQRSIWVFLQCSLRSTIPSVYEAMRRLDTLVLVLGGLDYYFSNDLCIRNTLVSSMNILIHNVDAMFGANR